MSLGSQRKAIFVAFSAGGQTLAPPCKFMSIERFKCGLTLEIRRPVMFISKARSDIRFPGR